MINIVALAFGIWLGGVIIGWLVTYWVLTEMRWADAESRRLMQALGPDEGEGRGDGTAQD